MRKSLVLMLFLLFLPAACSQDFTDKTVYDGQPLKIGFVGEVPDYQSEKVTFEKEPLDGIAAKADELSAEYDALFIMPDMFEELSTDGYTPFFCSLSIPTAFVDSDKGHLPFITEGVTYQTGFDLDNGSHSTVYLNSGGPDNQEDAWYFYQEDGGGHKKSTEQLYTEMLQKIDEL